MNKKVIFMLFVVLGLFWLSTHNITIAADELSVDSIGWDPLSDDMNGGDSLGDDTLWGGWSDDSLWEEDTLWGEWGDNTLGWGDSNETNNTNQNKEETQKQQSTQTEQTQQEGEVKILNAGTVELNKSIDIANIAGDAKIEMDVYTGKVEVNLKDFSTKKQLTLGFCIIDNEGKCTSTPVKANKVVIKSNGKELKKLDNVDLSKNGLLLNVANSSKQDIVLDIEMNKQDIVNLVKNVEEYSKDDNQKYLALGYINDSQKNYVIPFSVVKVDNETKKYLTSIAENKKTADKKVGETKTGMAENIAMLVLLMIVMFSYVSRKSEVE